MQEGYLVTFFTQHSREHNGTSLANWIVEEAKKIGVNGATLLQGREGFGHDGRFHSDSFFDMEDPPLLVLLAMSSDECDALMARIREEKVRVFFTKSTAEFGVTVDA